MSSGLISGSINSFFVSTFNLPDYAFGEIFELVVLPATGSEGFAPNRPPKDSGYCGIPDIIGESKIGKDY